MKITFAPATIIFVLVAAVVGGTFAADTSKTLRQRKLDNTGACCVDDGVPSTNYRICVEYTETVCWANNGEFYGVGVFCSEIDCNGGGK